MFYFELVLIGISLSIDAFSLALSLGLSNKFKNKVLNYSLEVGIFHFFMPMLGQLLKFLVNKIIYIPSKEIFTIVLIFLIIGIIIDKNHSKNMINPFLFASSVSIDSFVIGFSLNIKYLLIGSIIFSLVSFTITFIGFKLAGKIKDKVGKNTKVISILILVFLLIYNFLK